MAETGKGEMFMKWDLNLDVSAMLVMMILGIYGIHKKELPLRRNRLFYSVVISVWMVALTDIVSSIMCSFPQIFPVWSLYLINILYYGFKAVNPIAFLFYCLNLESRMKYTKLSTKILVYLPASFMLVLVLSSPLNHLIFSITPEGEFVYGPLRDLLFWESLYFFAISGIYLYRIRKILRSEIWLALNIAIGFSMVGQVLQTFFLPHTQSISLFNSLGILVIFLSYQNPDYFRDRVTTLFDLEGLRTLKAEDLRYRTYRPFVAMQLDNYQDLRLAYGDGNMDRLLEMVGKYIRFQFMDGPKFYVHSGRFMMMFDDNRQRDAAKERLISRFEEPFLLNGEAYYLSTSFFCNGSAISTKSVEEMQLLLELISEEARLRGKGADVTIDEEMYAKIRRQIEVGKALERAILNNSLLVYFQPIYSNHEGRISCAEALVRIRDPELGMIYPDEFIDLAEQNGSIIQLGHQVFEKTCEFICNHDMNELGLDYIEINLSPVQCMREQLSEELQQVLYRRRIDSRRINLEITESNHSGNQIARKNIMELAQYGIEFSLDDYGTGYSNLINVLSLPLKIVKIDKSIVWAYFRDDNPMLLHVLELFKESSLEIVCEGVEDQEMATKLRELGCDYEQGYYYSKPIPEEEFVEYILREKQRA